MREEHEEQIEQRDKCIDTLNSRIQELLDEGITLRKEVGEWKRKTTDAERAVQRVEQGLPINYRFSCITPPTSPSKGVKKVEEKPKEEGAKRRGKASGGQSPDSEYDEDFEDAEDFEGFDDDDLVSPMKELQLESADTKQPKLGAKGFAFEAPRRTGLGAARMGA